MKPQSFALLLPVALLAGACAAQPTTPPSASASASADLDPVGSSGVRGTAKLTQKETKLHLEVRVTGLEPGLHGLHVHEHGRCSGAEAADAGAHFNPTQRQHGGNAGTNRHAGDFGNVNADERGVAVLSVDIEDVTLDGERDGIVGRALIVHAGRDDGVTQPAGGSGAPVACGVIRGGTR